MFCFELHVIINFRFTIRALHAITGTKSCFVSDNNVLLPPKKQILAHTIACNALRTKLKIVIMFLVVFSNSYQMNGGLDDWDSLHIMSP